MQIRKLHRLLTELIKNGDGHKKVMVSKSTFKNPLEDDGCTIMPVKEVVLHTYNIMNDDGGFIHDNEQEKLETALVFSGDHKEE